MKLLTKAATTFFTLLPPAAHNKLWEGVTAPRAHPTAQSSHSSSAKRCGEEAVSSEVNSRSVRHPQLEGGLSLSSGRGTSFWWRSRW